VVQQAIQSLSSTFLYLTLSFQKPVDLFVGANYQHDTETSFLTQRLLLIPSSTILNLKQGISPEFD
jgi:hypothetical protein